MSDLALWVLAFVSVATLAGHIYLAFRAWGW